MWCRHCQQDVPAIAVSGERKYCCPRCGEGIAVEGPGESAAAKSTSKPSESVHVEESPFSDDWELDEQLRHIGRVLRIDKTQYKREQSGSQREVARLDRAHQKMEYFHAPAAISAARECRSKSRPAADEVTFMGVLAWLVLSLGTAALICGGILLAWSIVAGRSELWKLGLPIAAGGQIALLIGLVLQLDRIWHDNRRAVAKLDDELQDLKVNATHLGPMQGPSSGVFHSHLGGDDDPQALLRDLKSRLDLLAMKISEQE